jgi:glycerol-3-phosphate dehydrogenase
MPRHCYDVVVVGAGIVGATIARELTRYDLKIAILDKAADLPSGASRANSSMIHAGFDDKPGTVKADFCATGNRMYREELARELDFRLVPCGSYVCAFGSEEEPHLEKLLDQGKRNGVPGVEIISGDALRLKEPQASPGITRALWAPTASIVNNFEAVLAFVDNAQRNGADLFMETSVTGLLITEGKEEILGVRTDRGDFLAPIVINAAGVCSDRIARMAGDDSFAIRPTRGEYFIFDKTAGVMVRSFFFPCPSKRGKGITVARTAEDNLLIGPTSVPQTSREDTSTTWGGLEEVVSGAKRLIPNIPMGLAITTFAGLRANTVDGDFHIGVLPRPRGFVNAAGIKSPGFTSAPAIALHVSEMIREELADRAEFKPNRDFVPERVHIPRFAELSMEERRRLVAEDPRYAQIVCRCETVTEAQVVEAIRRGARTVAGVKIWTRAGGGRCQGGFCGPRVAEILSRELGIPLDEVTRHGGHSRLLVGKTKEYWFRGERA